jgi:predicted TIM-barrel fold metal-dependent hydrolase
VDGQRTFPVVDCDGHLVESIAELAEYLPPELRRGVLNPSRNREGLFPSLDGFHGPRIPRYTQDAGRTYVTASEHRTGSGEDYLAFLEKAEVEQGVVFTSEGLSVGLIQHADYAVRICRAYNDYVHDRYRRVSDRIFPMALIPMQNPKEAVLELRRAVKDLGLPGAMLPANGLPLHLGHEQYWPVYQEACDLDCALGIHGGAVRDLGIMETFSVHRAVFSMHHSIALLMQMAGFIGHGVLERFPTLRVGFLEGGCSWLTVMLDRAERSEEVTSRWEAGTVRKYLESGRILIGCEGNDASLPYLAGRIGIEPFAWASDYPHEVDLAAAKHMIEETVQDVPLTDAQKTALLADNARRFFRLPTLSRRAEAAAVGG